MSFSRPFQWYHSHADPIWPNGTFKRKVFYSSIKPQTPRRGEGAGAVLRRRLANPHTHSALLYLAAPPMGVLWNCP
jgi:hypothetical protein